VLNLATTNYPEQLDRRFVARPRRFDRVVRIDAADSWSGQTTRWRSRSRPEGRWLRQTPGAPLAGGADRAAPSARALGRLPRRACAAVRIRRRGVLAMDALRRLAEEW